MNIEEILKKNPDELTDEEKSFLAENKETLSDEDLVKFGLKEEETKTETPPETKTETPDETKTETKTEEKTAKEQAPKNGIVMSEDALKILESKAEQGAKAMAELNEMKVRTFVDSLTFSEHNSEGVIYPKSSDKVVKFALSLSDDQLKSFKEIMAELPKLKLFGEIGTDSNVPASKAKQFDELVATKMKEDKDLSYREAVEQVSAEHPDLAKSIIE